MPGNEYASLPRHVTQPCTHFRPCKRPVHDRITAVYTTVYTSGTRPCTSTRHVHGRRRPCTRPVHSRVHGRCIQAVCTACTRPCTRPWTGGTALVYGGLHGPYVYTAHTRQSTWPCNGSTYGKYTYSRYDSQRPLGQLTTRAPCSGRQQQRLLFFYGVGPLVFFLLTIGLAIVSLAYLLFVKCKMSP